MSEKEHNLCADNSLCCDDDCQKCANRIYKAYCREREKLMQKWIPVSERLPEEKTLVLCRWSRTSEEAFYGFARYQGSDKWYVSNEGMPTVAHWMPLPEPPKECE